MLKDDKEQHRGERICNVNHILRLVKLRRSVIDWQDNIQPAAFIVNQPAFRVQKTIDRGMWVYLSHNDLLLGQGRDLLDSNGATDPTAGLVRLLVDIRFALGDNGKMMQDELVDHCRNIGTDSMRYREILCQLVDLMSVIFDYDINSRLAKILLNHGVCIPETPRKRTITEMREGTPLDEGYVKKP